MYDDLPQANDIRTLCLVVRAMSPELSSGVDTVESLRASTKLPRRQMRYYVKAAISLGLVRATSDETLETSTIGAELAKLPEGSKEEYELLKEVVSDLPALRSLGINLFEESLSKDVLTQKLAAQSTLSATTLSRRVSCLWSWRNQLVATSSHQGELFDSNPTLDEGAPPPKQPASIDAPGFLDRYDRELIATAMRSGNLVAMTGAGFSVTARSRDGRPLPLGKAIRDEIYHLAYPSDTPEPNDTLPDVFDAVKRKCLRQLDRYLAERLSVDPSSLDDWYEHFFRIPWRKVYTLNVDDLADAAGVRWNLPRQPTAIDVLSKLRSDSELIRSVNGLPIVYLNGSARNGSENVTFGGSQYALRQALPDVAYSELSEDLTAYTTIIIGTELSEPVLWQYVQLRKTLASRSPEARPRSFVVTPNLSKVRQEQLQAFNMKWLQGTAEDFVQFVAECMPEEIASGNSRFEVRRSQASSNASNIQDVAEEYRNASATDSCFLQGEEPGWWDVRTSRIARTSFVASIESRVVEQLSESDATPERLPSDASVKPGRTKILVVLGPAGSGKSAACMLAATNIALEHSVSCRWLAPAAELSPHDLIQYCSNPHSTSEILWVDEAEKYRRGLYSIIRQVTTDGRLAMLVLTIRSHKWLQLVDSQMVTEQQPEKLATTNLADSDIDAILAVLKKESRLGRLASLSRDDQRDRLRDHAGRQLLVAMLEATSGVPHKQRIANEYSVLGEREKAIYAVICISSTKRYSVSLAEIALATGVEVVAARSIVKKLASSRIVIEDDGQYRARHRVIADEVVSHLQKSGAELTDICVGLVRSAYSGSSPGLSPNSRVRRFIASLLSARYVENLLEANASEFYRQLEEDLRHDHHYWLQRAISLARQDDLADAERCIEEAYGLEDSDRLVIHTLHDIRARVALNSYERESSKVDFREAMEALEYQIDVCGSFDPYPAAIFGRTILQMIQRYGCEETDAKELFERARTRVRDALRSHRDNAVLDALSDDLKHQHLRIVGGLARRG